ncbi:MAG: ribosome biogenesis GTPase Der [Christensenellaceae bacterium]|jgi:GTP-binding protein|nr:ribosome biogenesis GTPase Der [Christensenellaceae bacterium]
MQKIPVVAVVGRPNVGKSTLFNVLSNTRKSIVDDTAGVTRDRIYAECEWCGYNFNLVDTGGVDFDEKNAFGVHIVEQVQIAVDIADCIICVVDGLVGITANDERVVKLLRKYKKPIVLCVNKLDNQRQAQNNLAEFYRLGVGEPFAVSCTQKSGLGDMLDAVVSHIKKIDWDSVGETEHIAIVGKPNAGKSSIVNAILGEKRVMVSEIAGTTRDAVDTPFNYNGKQYILTDTAGIRRKRSVEIETVEHYSVLRAIAAIRNSDVAVLVIDATEGVTEQDVRLAGYAHEDGKPSLIVINKWDLVEKDTFTQIEFQKNLERDLAFMSYFKSIYISAKTGKRIGEVMKTVAEVLATTKKRITTGQLNTLVLTAVGTTPPPMVGGKRPKFLYATQVSVSPPTFAIFVKNSQSVQRQYLRYIENTLRKSVDFSGTPIKILLRDKQKEEQ